MGIIHIKNLRLRTFIGFQPWETGKKQDVVISLKLNIGDEKAHLTDDPNHTVNYKHLTKRIVAHVEESKYNTLEALSASIVSLALDYSLVRKVWIRVEKPHALRFADAVAYETMVTR